VSNSDALPQRKPSNGKSGRARPRPEALALTGAPYAVEGLGGFVFLSAFPFLWLNERREAPDAGTRVMPPVSLPRSTLRSAGG